MEEPLVIAALRQAIKARQPAYGLVHHTDRGGQYAGKKYRKILARRQKLGIFELINAIRLGLNHQVTSATGLN